ncbi:hypothetical protein PPL_10930 [Heterostelium album PN500]|uniref:Malonyl-CoA decarboxylase C-terminal domain-containing protein n=1 Tax=Heterostelium pallidum (strain ATCC 26659 / Pp 5 / PN500) TaxID=670386 RepID=D3BSG2_HETP5|nr:hypothetical protein PPL_10930 [Heterostelium album PN500]EFA75668.1 hypothetical protein PPL_10930 [Heterostelium album PN500]|eukprot:XP_020427802.1 hypothetical protein PPL_10930 [Heterostelium album PN500]
MKIINEKQVDLTKVDSAMFYSISSLHKGLKNVDLGHILISRATEYLQINPQIKNFCTLSPIPNFRNYLKRRSNQDESIKGLLNINDLENIEENKDKLTSLCLRYLFVEKKKNNKAMDPVCNFHLKNGASIYRLNWSGDTSSQRINESYGLMVNYLYLTSAKSSNSINYKQNGVITHQKPIDQLATHLNITIK